MVHVPSILPPACWPGPLQLLPVDGILNQGMGMGLASQLVDLPKLNPSAPQTLAHPFGELQLNPLFAGMFNATLATRGHTSTQGQGPLPQLSVGQVTRAPEPSDTVNDKFRSHRVAL